MGRTRVGLFIIVCTLRGYELHDDVQALAFCKNNKNSFVAIIWPIAQGKDARILQIMEKFGHVVYGKDFYFTQKLAHKILKEAHPKY